jgi:hypothetical protein
MIIGPAGDGDTYETDGAKDIHRATFPGLCVATQISQLCAELKQSGDTARPLACQSTAGRHASIILVG